MRKFLPILLLLVVAAIVGSIAAATRIAASQHPADVAAHAPWQILNLVYASPVARKESLTWLDTNWRATDTAMLVESLRYIRSPATRRDAANLLESKTGQNNGLDIDAWFHWLWQQPAKTTSSNPGYAKFKSALYAKIDPHFVPYFTHIDNPRIRLDEIRWGGVRQNGIPPLRQPAMLNADEADYLNDSNPVFGVDINGDARAYPLRIMGHHEMFVDTVGGVPVTGVYCTLCGAMIIYESNGHRLGTSGFLYRSNKLMFDEQTNSLWSTLLGIPVTGPLVGKGIVLKRRPVVTSTWGQWRKRHPDTTVLDIHTGYKRDYAEGAAYHDYFATDKLMFAVPTQFKDNALPNKAQVLALRDGDDALAISAKFLNKHPVYQDTLNGQNIVVLTDASGANRVYSAKDRQFSAGKTPDTVIDDKQHTWTASEHALTGPQQQTLPRIPANRAFWFGWKAALPDTRLVH